MSWSGLGLEFLMAAGDVDPAVSPLAQMLPFVMIAVMFVVLVWMPNSRDQKKRREQLNAMKKNDRVYTSSGIIGTIANISADGKEVTLKVDDNTKIRVFRRAIEGFYSDPSTTESTTPT